MTPNAPLSRFLACSLFLLLSGCAAPQPAPGARTIAATARPLLTLNPDVVWTDAYNQLLALGPDVLDWLMQQPAMTRPAAPGDLNVLLHTSLVRLLADPLTRPPPLTLNAYETTFGLLHFDPKAGGRRLGPVVIPPGTTPRRLRDLYPAEFDHRAAAGVDLERDRSALQAWWRARRTGGAAVARPLRAQQESLWPLLGRRYANVWECVPDEQPIRASTDRRLCLARERRDDKSARLCSFAWRWAGDAAGMSVANAVTDRHQPPTEGALFRLTTCDYNLVRAACLRLGSSPDPAVRDRLIELLASPAPIVAHNARFALRYSPDERVRAILRRHDSAANSQPAAPPAERRAL